VSRGYWRGGTWTKREATTCKLCMAVLGESFTSLHSVYWCFRPLRQSGCWHSADNMPLRDGAVIRRTGTPLTSRYTRHCMGRWSRHGKGSLMVVVAAGTPHLRRVHADLWTLTMGGVLAGDFGFSGLPSALGQLASVVGRWATRPAPTARIARASPNPMSRLRSSTRLRLAPVFESATDPPPDGRSAIPLARWDDETEGKGTCVSEAPGVGRQSHAAAGQSLESLRGWQSGCHDFILASGGRVASQPASSLSANMGEDFIRMLNVRGDCCGSGPGWLQRRYRLSLG
jgi:hypothetical protein